MSGHFTDLSNPAYFYRSHWNTGYLGAALHGSEDGSEEFTEARLSPTQRAGRAALGLLITLSFILLIFLLGIQFPVFSQTMGPISISVEQDGTFQITADGAQCVPLSISSVGAVISCPSGGIPSQPERQDSIQEEDGSVKYLDERSA